MKLLFAHDHPFYRDLQGQVYSTGQWSYPVWQRYLGAFDHLVVAARMSEISASGPSGLEPCSGPGVSFIALPSLSHPISLVTQRRTAIQRIGEVLVSADAVIARLPSENGALAISVAQGMRKPWAVELVGCTWDSLWNHGRWLGKIYAPYAIRRTKALVRRAPYALYVTQQFLQGRYPCQGKTVACSNVEIPETGSEVLAQRLTAIQSHRGPLRIGLIGQLWVRYKGIDTAFEALRVGRDRLPPFEFRLLGHGDPQPWRQMAARLGLADRTTFCPPVSGGMAVFRWLDEIDLYIQPSLTEGLPRAVIEAMSRGCPVLGSTAGGIPELLSPDCLHHPGDPFGLAERLVRAAHDRNW